MHLASSITSTPASHRCPPRLSHLIESLEKVEKLLLGFLDADGGPAIPAMIPQRQKERRQTDRQRDERPRRETDERRERDEREKREKAANGLCLNESVRRNVSPFFLGHRLIGPPSARPAFFFNSPAHRSSLFLIVLLSLPPSSHLELRVR